MKVLRIILRDSFVADPKKGLYFIYTDGIWMKSSEEYWRKSIFAAVEQYAIKYSWKKPDDNSIKKAITFLFKDNIHTKVHGDMDGFRIAAK